MDETTPAGRRTARDDVAYALVIRLMSHGLRMPQRAVTGKTAVFLVLTRPGWTAGGVPD
jgi:hypothetical protein